MNVCQLDDGWMDGPPGTGEQIICVNIFLFPIASSIFTDFAWHLFHNSPRFNPHCQFILTLDSEFRDCCNFWFAPQCIWGAVGWRGGVTIPMVGIGRKKKKTRGWFGSKERLGGGKWVKGYQLDRNQGKPSAVRYCPMKTPGAGLRSLLRGSLHFAAIWWLLLQQFAQKKFYPTALQHLLCSRLYSRQSINNSLCFYASLPMTERFHIHYCNSSS